MQAVYVGLDGQEWLFDEENLTLADYFVIKAACQLTRVQFLTGILDEDPTALQALVWFLRRKDEPALSLGAVNFKPAALTVRPVVEEPESPTAAAPSETPSAAPTSEPSSETETSSSAATTTSTSSSPAATYALSMSTP